MSIRSRIINKQEKYSSFSLIRWLEHPVSSLPLALFRILFGLLMFATTLRFMLKGWVQEFYVQPSFHFTYLWFAWVKPLNETGMMTVFILMLLATLFISLGFFYRLSIISFFLLFSYVELLDKSYYLNHYYFVSLLSFLLIFLPLNARLALDNKRNPNTHQTSVPAWTINAIKLQLIILYVFAGIAKLNPDWLFAAQPLRIWLRASTELPIIGWLFAYTWVAYAMSWAGLLYDLSIAFFLSWRKTRPYAYLVVIAFHVLTSILFPIGMFPWIMLTATLIFFDEEDIARVLGRLLKWHQKTLEVRIKKSAKPSTLSLHFLIIVPLIVLFFGFQIIQNLRHHSYPSNVLWAEEGFRFSWRVMLMEKTGFTLFTVRDNDSKQTFTVLPSDYLNPQQVKQMSFKPDMILQFAHHVRDDFRAKGFDDLSVFVEAHASLNGRRSQLLIDPERDLADVTFDLRHKDWVLPLKN